MKIDEMVMQMSPPRFTRSQAAALVGKSGDTLARWRDSGVYLPSDKRMFGELCVDLYTWDDIIRMRQLARGTKRVAKKSSVA